MRNFLVKNLPKLLTAFVVLCGVAAYFTLPEVQHFLDEAWRVLTGGDEQEIKNWVDSSLFTDGPENVFIISSNNASKSVELSPILLCATTSFALV